MERKVVGITNERKRQLESEIEWLKNKLKTVKKEKHRRELQHQITEREYNIKLGLWKP